MNTNRGYRDSSPAFPSAPGSNKSQDDWGEDPEEDVFDRPTIIPEILPTEAELIAGKLPPTRPPPSFRALDEGWDEPSSVIEKAPPVPPLTAPAAARPASVRPPSNSELEFDLDDLGPPSSSFAPPKGPGKAKPISFNNLSPLPPRPALTPRPLSTSNQAATKVTPPARPAVHAPRPEPVRSAAASASRPIATPPPPPAHPPAATLVVEDPLAFDLQLSGGLEDPRRESFPDDFDLDLEAVRNPKMREAPSMPPLVAPEDGSEPHTEPYPFDLDPLNKEYAAGHFRQPPPSTSPTFPLDDLDHLLEEEQPHPGKLKPVMSDTPPPPRATSPQEQHLRDMRDRFALGDFSGSLKAAEALLALSPGNAEATRFLESCHGRLRGMYEAKLGSLAGVPRVILPPEQVRWLSLDHRAGFLLSCIDGSSSIEELLDVSGMPHIDALRILHELLVQKVIAVS